MTNHVHLIASAKEEHNLSDIIRDLKRHTSKELIGEILSNPKESRKSWMEWIFKSAGEKNGNNTNYQFWQQDNRPVQLSTNDMMSQRLAYLHANPVTEGYVMEAEHYIYSSARDYSGDKGILDVELVC